MYNEIIKQNKLIPDLLEKHTQAKNDLNTALDEFIRKVFDSFYYIRDIDYDDESPGYLEHQKLEDGETIDIALRTGEEITIFGSELADAPDLNVGDLISTFFEKDGVKIQDFTHLFVSRRNAKAIVKALNQCKETYIKKN